LGWQFRWRKLHSPDSLLPKLYPELKPEKQEVVLSGLPPVSFNIHAPIIQLPTLQIDIHPTGKQYRAWQYLFDEVTTELLFGGGAGGGKSRLGCEWLGVMCLRYPGSRWLMGRATLTSLKGSTLLTFLDVMREWGWKEDRHFTINHQANSITFINGSVIFLKALAIQPSDPDYEEIGSTEYTGAFVDEATQITAKCKDVIKARLRYRLKEFGLLPKLLMTCNPSKNWVYATYYRPWRENKLLAYQAFIQALAKNNPHLPDSYIASLHQIKDRATKERLLCGNWEYDDDPNALFPYDAILDLFSNTVDNSDQRFITCDAARKGRDMCEIFTWRGLEVIDIHEMPISLVPEIVKAVGQRAEVHKVQRSHILVDEDSVGGGAVDYLGCKGFMGGGSPLQHPIEAKQTYKLNYANLRSQCYYTLSDLTIQGKVAVRTEDEEFKRLLTEELEQVKAVDPDKDAKLRVTRKDVINDHIERSPDRADTLMMRMYFELDPTPVVRIR
jgi:phage terminase large subunit